MKLPGRKRRLRNRDYARDWANEHPRPLATAGPSCGVASRWASRHGGPSLSHGSQNASKSLHRRDAAALESGVELSPPVVHQDEDRGTESPEDDIDIAVAIDILRAHR